MNWQEVIINAASGNLAFISLLHNTYVHHITTQWDGRHRNIWFIHQIRVKDARKMDLWSSISPSSTSMPASFSSSVFYRPHSSLGSQQTFKHTKSQHFIINQYSSSSSANECQAMQFLHLPILTSSVPTPQISQKFSGRHKHLFGGGVRKADGQFPHVSFSTPTTWQSFNELRLCYSNMVLNHTDRNCYHSPHLAYQT